MKKKPTNPPQSHDGRIITLHLIISNGNPIHDVRLDFEFAQCLPDQPQLWVLSLPQLTNLDAFARQVSTDMWELHLDAVAETQPVEAVHFTRANVNRWLARVLRDSRRSRTELLIFARDAKFNTTIIDFPSRLV